MKLLIRFSLLGVMTALLSSGLAYAEPGDKRFRRQPQVQQGRQENATQKPHEDEVARGEHRHKLSQEERRQLRRDIDEAGRDIYRVRRGRR